MKLNDLRNRARDGIEPDREYNSPLLPQKTFLGMDLGIGESVSFFISKSRDYNLNTGSAMMKEYQALIEVDWSKLDL